MCIINHLNVGRALKLRRGGEKTAGPSAFDFVTPIQRLMFVVFLFLRPSVACNNTRTLNVIKLLIRSV